MTKKTLFVSSLLRLTPKRGLNGSAVFLVHICSTKKSEKKDGFCFRIIEQTNKASLFSFFIFKKFSRLMKKNGGKKLLKLTQGAGK